MIVKIKKEHEDFVMPLYAKEGDAGMDLTAVSMETSGKFIEYNLGFSLELPKNYVALIFPRSSISNKVMYLTNSVGIIDSGFRGNITVRFRRNMPGVELYDIGDKVAQMIIIPYPNIELELVDKLSTTERGKGGYGHTDKK